MKEGEKEGRKPLVNSAGLHGHLQAIKQDRFTINLQEGKKNIHMHTHISNEMLKNYISISGVILVY